MRPVHLRKPIGKGHKGGVPQWLLATAVVVSLAIPTSNACGNDIAQAAGEIESGRLQFVFPAREGVHGDGNNISINVGSRSTWRSGPNSWRRNWCDVCDIEVTITYRNSEMRRLRWRIGASSQNHRDDLRDLGAVDASMARDFLMELAENENDQINEEVAEEALEAAVLSKAAVPWRQLLALARNRDRGRSLRSTALFWLGHEAQEVVTRELEGVVGDELEDLEVRKAALFALSQRPDHQSIPSLERIALEHRDMELRRNALFWLAQKDAPEVVDFFEEILMDAERR